MELKSYKLKDLIVLSEEKNSDNVYTLSDVKGISNQKMFIETKANMIGVSLTPYFVVKPKYFAYVPTTSRNGDKITITLNNTKNSYIVSSSYIVFYIKDTNILLPDFLFMYFNRSEFDRYARFNSWGSAREVFDWKAMCDIELELPSIDIQQKYVNIYNAMVQNQRCYERGLDDLKLVCDAYIEKLGNRREIGDALQEITIKNTKGEVTKEKGVSVSKRFIDTKASASDLTTQKIVNVNEFAFNSNTSRNGDTLSIALNNDVPYIVSNTYVVCKTDESVLLPQYLFLWFCRKEFDRYARFNSWGSARETISLKELQDYKISIPSLEVQTAIANIYKVYFTRREINERLKAQIKDLCPILIKGAIEEALKEKEVK